MAALILAFLGTSLVVMATDDHPFSFLDEHTHYDTALKLHAGELSYRGALFEEEVVDEWACGVGHQAGALPHGCGDPDLSVRDVPGVYTTGYIHYPTYFVAAEGFRAVLDAIVGPHHPLTDYRLFSALLMWLGAAVGGIFAFALGIRRWGLIASVTVPAAATIILVMGTMVTPNSAALLAGSLVAGTGLLWIKRGRGFVWLALSALVASCIGVISSLPVGGFILLVFGAILARAFKWRFDGAWRPRWWQGAVLAVIVVAPVIVWGRYISATATVSNDALYGPWNPQGWRQVVTGAVQELFAFHTPWMDWNLGMPATGGTFSMMLRVAAGGIPQWVTIAVVGALLVAILAMPAMARITTEPAAMTTLTGGATGEAEVDVRRPRTFDAHRALALATLLTMILYPAALRISNILNFGLDSSIVARYSMAFTPLLVLLALLLIPQRSFAVVLALLGVAGVIAGAGIWI